MKYLALETQADQRVSYQQYIKEQNIKRVFDLVRSGRCASRAELVRTMHLSATTISALVEELHEDGLVIETGPTLTSTPGRRPMRLRLNYADRQLAIFSLSRRGVRFTLFDLGCRPIESLFVEYSVGEEENGDLGESYATLFEELLMRKSRCFNRAKAIVIGVSFPGIYLEEEQAFSVRAAMNVSFSEKSMRGLVRRLGVPLLLGNVSMCLAYAEKKYIDASRCDDDELRDLIYVNICDGVGAGIINNGEMLARDERITGEIGHITVVPQGRKCDCGNRGCLERYVNVNEIIARVREAVSKDTSGAHGVALRALMENPTLDRIGSAYDAGVECVVGVIDDIAEKLFSGICCMVAITGIRLIVIGGLEAMGEGFLRRLHSLTEGECPAILMRGVRMMYSDVSADADNIGLAQYYMDKKFYIDA